MSLSNCQFGSAIGASVVECPSCSTRFAMDAQQISKIAEPIFHCSRCGHYFGIKDKKLDSIQGLEKQFEQERIQEDSVHAQQLDLMPEEINPEQDFTAPEATSRKTWFTAQDFSYSDDLDSLNFSSDDDSKEEDTTVKADWPNSYAKKQLEDKKASNTKKSSYYFESESKYCLDLSKFEDELEEEAYLPKSVSQKGIFKRFFRVSSDRTVDEDYSIEPKEEKRVSIFKTAFIILTFPIIFALLLAFWGLNIDKTPAILMSFFNMDSKLLATVAPSGLALTSLSPEIVTLDSGEKAFRIKGDVINSTGITFSNLTLEAKLFTQDNRELVRVIAPLDNSLRDTNNISALNAESIERLQNESTDEATTIHPNIKIPFSLVVPGVKGEEAWYSARIYSVIRI